MTNAEVLDLLALGRSFVEAGWCQMAPASDRDDLPLQPEASGAARFCALGAIDRARYELRVRREVMEAALDLLYHALPRAWGNVASYNDHPARRKRDVLRLFDKAAAEIGK